MNNKEHDPEMPCNKKGCSAETRASCCGCPEYIEWEKRRKKPPIGIEPRYIHDSRRAIEILEAIERYTEANMSIPKSWIEELRSLFEVYFSLTS